MHRLLIISLGVMLVVAGCSSPPSETVRSSTTVAPGGPPAGNAPAAFMTEMPAFSDDGDPIEPDPAVTIGVLENGLTYYIRRNTRPGSRAELRLVVAAGSALEDDDQRGAAHFLEHMMFNGTASFPANELILVLERFGAAFGPDINAYTNLDQTVYELEVPTDVPGNVETALDVLLEWSSRAALDPLEVDAERGVLLEEWRLRSQSFGGRYFDAVADVLLAGSPYAGHDPLADGGELDATTAATLRRFYTDWYRPDLMAVVAVGDFDVDEVETMIRDRFAVLDGPARARPRPRLATEPFSEPGFVVLADPESPNAFLELNYPLPAVPSGTIGALRQELALDLAFSMLITRLDEDARRTDTPFFEPSFAANPFVDGQRTPGLAAFAEPADLAETARVLLAEVRRVLLHGFDDAELNRAVAERRSAVDLDFEGVRSKQDEQYAAEYVARFLTGAPTPDAEAGRDLTVRLLEEMTTGVVSDVFRATVGITQPVVIAAGPASAGVDIPSEQALRTVVTAVSGAELAPREQVAATADRLMARPDPVAVESRTSLGTLRPTVIRLANGVRVAYVESDIAADTVSMRGSSPGGWLSVPEQDALEAQLVGSIVAESGVGDLDQVDLSRFLSGDLASVFTYVDETTEEIVGSAESDDLELLFQLIHLYLTEPRVDERAWQSLRSQLRPLAVDRDGIPFLALSDRLQLRRYAGDERYLAIPTVADLDTFDLDRALALQRERFSDAADFVFAFAGDFDAETLEDLAGRYLGSLPTGGTAEAAGTGQPPAPDGVVLDVVAAGDGQLGAVVFQFSQERALTPDERLTLPLLNSVLNQRLTALLREELGATYSPAVTVVEQYDPVALIEVSIEVSGDPAGLQTIADALTSDIADLVANGPTEDEFGIATQQTVRDYELIGNQFWLDTMIRYVANPDLDPDELAGRIPETLVLDRSDVRELAEAVLPLDDYIRVDLVPAG